MTIKRVSPDEALALLGEGYVFIDVRTEEEFAAGHPQGAYNIPYMVNAAGGMQKNAAFINTVESHFPSDARIVLGCRSGNRSMKAAGELLALGYTTLVDQRAGWDGARNSFGQVTEAGWGPKGLPSATAAESGKAYAELRK